MSKCKICCKEFKYQWCLDRHLRRKIPCKEKNENHTQHPVDLSLCPVDLTPCIIDPVDLTSIPVDLTSAKIVCKFCNKHFTRKDNKKTHEGSCKDRYDIVRTMEIQLGIEYPSCISKNECRFCHHESKTIYLVPKHIQKCKAKQEYRELLEAKLKEKTKQQQPVNQTINNQNNTINLNISAETLRKFGDENTDHITNAYLRRLIGRLGVTLPTVVSTLTKQIYCDDTRPENKTVQITNVRSQWAKVSNGNVYELQPLGDSVKGVRNKVTDLYVTRQCDDWNYFKPVNSKIERLDDLNNQNYTARTLEDKEDQKNASKLKSEIDREIKATLYNIQKQIVIKV